jgi:hypothetical protein
MVNLPKAEKPKQEKLEMKKSKIDSMSIQQLQEIINSKHLKLHSLSSKRQSMESELNKITEEILALSGTKQEESKKPKTAKKTTKKITKKIAKKIAKKTAPQEEKSSDNPIYEQAWAAAHSFKKLSNGRIINSTPIQTLIHKILSKSVNPMNAEEIIKELKASGFKSSAKDWKKMLSSAFYNHKRLFSSPKKGLYTIKK